MSFHVGQKVECIYKFRRQTYNGVAPPKVGQIYTVVDVTQGATQPGLVLAEIYHHNPLGWAARRFRPIIERKTDISIFTAMLNPSKVEA